MSATQLSFLIFTWGCQMNEDDSIQMKNILEQNGYRQVSKESDADVIILNTCSVRAKPEQKVMSKLGELWKLKQAKPNLIIGVCGCMAQLGGRKLLQHMPFIDFILGTANLYELPVLIKRVMLGEKGVVNTDLPDRNGNLSLAHVSRVIKEVYLRMYVPIMYGCNNFCTYCVVPYTRGPERSRSPEEIIQEISTLTSLGCREVTLIGQNVNSYGLTMNNNVDFSHLLKLVQEIDRLARIRFTTSHPKDLSDRLIATMGSLPKVCEHLHLPVQAGDDTILSRMGRGYTRDYYLDLVKKIRTQIPGISLTTDVMVGFPGETEEHFRQTIALVEEVRFDDAFMFAFNARPGTSASQMPNQVEPEVKKHRLRTLIEVQNSITLENNRKCIGKVFEVLVEGPSKSNPRNMMGRTRTNKLMVFPGGTEVSGLLVQVRAVSAHPWGLFGELVGVDTI